MRCEFLLPSLLMPILRQVFSLQYWHWLRWCWSMGQFLFPRHEYVRFRRTLLLKKLLQPVEYTTKFRFISHCNYIPLFYSAHALIECMRNLYGFARGTYKYKAMRPVAAVRKRKRRQDTTFKIEKKVQQHLRVALH